MTQADAGSSGQSRICRAEAEAAPRQKGMPFIFHSYTSIASRSVKRHIRLLHGLWRIGFKTPSGSVILI